MIIERSSMIANYYKERWATHIPKCLGDDPSRLRFIRWWIHTLSFNPRFRPSILDFGCGSGWMTTELAKLGDARGVDIEITEAHKNHPDINFIQADVLKDDLSGQYDFVVSSEVIEHLPGEIYKQAYLKKVYDLLKPSGYLILTTPNRPIVERLFDTLPRAKKHRQPVEDWLDKEELEALVSTYFHQILHFGSSGYCPMLLRENQISNAAWFVFYNTIGEHLLYDWPAELKGAVRILLGYDFQKWLHWRGLYFALVARK